uniref:DUF2235 domain-containing protein n=1 Tax=Meloidogyne hapla TaxID=6305 RepID=A0A1I8BEF4_MELHA
MSKIVFITDEGSNVSHLGGNKHHKCIAHILATISRHITQPYAAEKANDDVIAVESAIDDLHVFVSDLSLAAFGNDTMRTEIDYEMEQYQIGCKNLGGQKLDLLNFWKTNSKKFPHLASFRCIF